MSIPPLLRIDDQSPIPIRRQLTDQLKHLIEGGGVTRDQPLPSIRELEARLPARVDKVRLEDLAATVRRTPPPRRWRAAVTSFFHFPEVARLLTRRGLPVIPLLTGVHLDTLHRLAQLPPGTRVGVA